MSGFRPANRKFDQLRKGPGTLRGASKTVLRPPPVRYFSTMLANSRHKSACQGRGGFQNAWKGFGRVLQSLSKRLFGHFYTPKQCEDICMCYINIYTYTYTRTRLNTAITLSAYPSSGLPSYRLTVLPSCRLIVSTSCRLTALPPHTLTISPYYPLNVFCFTVLQFYRVCRFAVLPPYHLAVLPP